MPALSPRTQQLQAGMSAGPDQEAQIFENGFSEMAYNLLSTRMPDVIEDVVTFKVLETDVDKGTGVGAFVMLRHGAPIYVPVVMCDNAIKPIEVFYHKALNLFLPLTKGWLDEIDKGSLAALGTGVKTPETLYTDVDIRNVVVPPITGRFSYAAWQPKAEADVARVLSVENLDRPEAKEAAGRPMLLEVLDRAPNAVKAAFARRCQRNPIVIKHAAAWFGVDAIVDALRPRLEKSAAGQHTGGALWIADKDTKPTAFRRVFGDQAAKAYSGVRVRGYAAKDTREGRNSVVREQPYASWIEPTQPGTYVLYDLEGRGKPALVVPNPIDLFAERDLYASRPSSGSRTPRKERVYAPGRPHERRRSRTPRFLAVHEDGTYAEFDKLVGTVSVADEIGGALHERAFAGADGSPRVGKGFFVRQTGTSLQATTPIEIKSIATGEDGVRRIRAVKASGYSEEQTLITDARSPHASVWAPKGSRIVYVPSSFSWIPLKERRPDEGYFQSPLDLQRCVSSALAAVGARRVAVKDAGAGQLSIDGRRPAPRVEALKKLAYELRLPVADAEALIKGAEESGRAEGWVVSARQLARAQMRLAAEDDKGRSKDSDKPKRRARGQDDDGPAPSDSPAADPGLGEEAAMAAMAPVAPPPPAPLDLAAMEMDQHIQQEMQKLLEKQQTIQMLLQRSSEIAGGAPPAPTVQTQAMGAPPSSMNLATGGSGTLPGVSAPEIGMAPMPGQPVPPDTMSPPASDNPMGTDPAMGDQFGMGMPPMADPAMGGMPGMGAPQAGAMMPHDGPNASSIDTEVNPQFLDQAARLHSVDMFDAAAVASLAQSPALHGIVAQYLPNLEKAIDNLARVLLTLWMQEYDLKAGIGEATFAGLEDNMRATLKTLGDLVLRLSRGVQAIKEPDGHEA